MLKKIGKSLVWVLYTLFSVFFTLVSGCAYFTPTRVPPMTKELGYEVLNYKGWTTTGLNEGTYKLELEKLKLFRVMVDVVNEPALEAREQVIDWVNVGLSAGVFGGIPLAYMKDPKKRKR
jgi:hypothetical protein